VKGHSNAKGGEKGALEESGIEEGEGRVKEKGEKE